MSAEFRQVVSVFLASPGDLKPEREIAKAVVARFNKLYSRHFNLTLELVIWEDVPSSYGRPQEIINRDHLARCELFVGMLNERWGSETGKYSSGFEEEFTISEESMKATGRPAMSLLFKHVDEARRNDPGKEFAKVLAFKGAVGDRILHNTFKGEGELKEQLEDILIAHVLGLKAKQASLAARDTQARPAGGGASAEGAGQQEGVPQLPPEGVAFLRAFATKAQSTSEASPLTRVEIARFRLLSTLVSEGNDEEELGVHDANALFTHRDDVELSDREGWGLVDAGIVQFKSENVPYWHWLIRVKGLDDDSLSIRSLFGSRARRIGALRLMRLLRRPIVEVGIFERPLYRKYWFHPSTAAAVREAALEYLAVCGTDDDMVAVRKEVDEGGYQTQKAANHAYVRILLRRNAEEALRALVELDFEGVTQDVVTQVFVRPEVLVTETLVAATAHRSLHVRRAATGVLRARQALGKDLTEQLSADDAPAVRLEALLARAEAGETISDETAKSVLVQRKSASRGLGAFGRINFLGLASETEGDEQLAEFRGETLMRLSAAELKRQAAEAHIFDQAFVFEAIRRAFAQRGDELREGLRDQFKAWFERKLAEFAALGIKDETLNRVRGLEDSLRKEWTRAALDIVVARENPADLNLVRRTLASEYVAQNNGDMRYLAAVGEWSDIEAVLAFSENLRGGMRRTIIGSFLNEDDNEFIASCLCDIAKTRLFDLLSLNLSSALRPWIVKRASPAAIRTLKNAQIIGFLRDSNDGFRRAMVLRAISCLAATRVASLFKGYMEPEAERYYNVTVWLDMAMSLDRSQAIDVARRALVEQES